MIRSVLLVVALAGCDMLWNIDKVPPAGASDDAAPIDVGRSVDGNCPAGETAVGNYGMGGAGLFSVCVPPTGPVELTANINTDATVSTPCVPGLQDNGASVCIVFGDDITIPMGVKVKITGLRPLVLAASGTITIAGSIDLAALPGNPGPGGDVMNCTAGKGDDNAQKGAAGGGGGSWSSLGGKGGDGRQSAKGGLPSPPGTISSIRGGCQGGKGGAGQTANTGGNGGHGGGAIYLVAGTRVTVTGVVTASGGGGRFGAGATIASGGGGGGSGGLVAFDTPHLVLDPLVDVFANGGGGGGGGGTTGNGTDGSVSLLAVMPGSGGGGGNGTTPTSRGGEGGQGAVGTQPGIAGSGGGTNAGGGGGGGGAGFVVLYSPERGVANAELTSPALIYY